MKTLICNGRIVTPYRILEEQNLLIEDGKITDICSRDSSPDADQVIDVDNRYISPGLIDLHTHGGGGHDYMDGTAEDTIGAAMTHMRHGTTSIMPTTMTATMEEIYGALDAYMEAKRIIENGPNLLGIHLEGPYVSPARNGGQDKSYLRAIDTKEISDLLDYCPDIKRISMAPEENGGMEAGRLLRDRNVIASIGHSDAMYEDVLAACENGYSLVTHYYSGNSTLARKTHRRELGIIETAYLVDDLDVEIICDGIHLPPELLNLIFRQKCWNNIILTTDSNRGVDMPEGSEVMLGSRKNGQLCYVEGGVAMMWHRKSYGGSIATTDRCVRTLVQQANIPLTAAVRMMSMNPARVAGLKYKGKIAIGMDADLCFFKDDIVVDGVMVNGKITHNIMK